MDGLASRSRYCSRLLRSVRYYKCSSRVVGRHLTTTVARDPRTLGFCSSHTPRTSTTCRQSFGSVRCMSTCEYSEDAIEVPDDLREPLVAYARTVLLQSKTLNEWAELEPPPARLRGKYSRTRSFLEGAVSLVDRYDRTQEQIEELTEMMKEPDLLSMARSEIGECRESLVEISNLLASHLFPPEEIEDRACILEVRAGIGGTEAAMFSQELFEMYERFVRYKGGKFDVTSLNPGPEDGYRDASALVDGKSLFGALRFESGVHRVQRVPKSEQQGRRHTSTAAVLILPVATETDIVIEQKDLKVETLRASGAGGQHVQKTESAVRVTHIPTGIAFRSETSRVQSVNRDNAVTMLRAKLFDIQSAKKDQEDQEQRKSLLPRLDYGAKVRTFAFNLMMINDHRFDLKSPGLTAIMTNPADTGAFLKKISTAAKVKGIRNAVKSPPQDYISEFKPVSVKSN